VTKRKKRTKNPKSKMSFLRIPKNPKIIIRYDIKTKPKTLERIKDSIEFRVT
tara:strand:- start:457 stop:612 length:156 start_codon:yes stop_codon:yes gene_type:complete